MQRLLGPQVKPQHVYTDTSKDFESASRELNWPHDTSARHRSQTNGVVERSVRVVKKGTSCTIVQSGLADKWWPEAMMCFCFLRNVSTLLDDGDTAYKKRFKTDFSGPLIPFGAEVSHLPITHKDKSKSHAFGSKVLPGIFLGYSQQAGGGWSGDLSIVDWGEMANAQSFSDIHIKRFQAKEVTPTMRGGSCLLYTSPSPRD